MKYETESCGNYQLVLFNPYNYKPFVLEKRILKPWMRNWSTSWWWLFCMLASPSGDRRISLVDGEGYGDGCLLVINVSACHLPYLPSSRLWLSVCFLFCYSRNEKWSLAHYILSSNNKKEMNLFFFLAKENEEKLKRRRLQEQKRYFHIFIIYEEEQTNIFFIIFILIIYPYPRIKASTSSSNFFITVIHIRFSIYKHIFLIVVVCF